MQNAQNSLSPGPEAQRKKQVTLLLKGLDLPGQAKASLAALLRGLDLPGQAWLCS